MKISVVTAVFNRVSTVADAVRSVNAQDYSNVEHIIQDGCSTDGTLEKIKAYSYRATHVVSEVDYGIYDAINRGITRSTGDVVGLVHSDDLLAHNEVLSKVAAKFDDPKIDGVYGDLTYVAGDDPFRVVRYWRSGNYHPELLKRGWMPPHPTLYLRRRVFEQHGLYDTNFRISADYDAMLRYLCKGNINLAYIPEVLVKMRVGGESNRSLSQILLKSREDLFAIRRNGIGGIVTLALKNLSKISQFATRESQASK